MDEVKPPAPDAKMWGHYCEPEKGWLMVAKGEPCNWCDAKELPEPPAYAAPPKTE